MLQYIDNILHWISFFDLAYRISEILKDSCITTLSKLYAFSIKYYIKKPFYITSEYIEYECLSRFTICHYLVPKALIQFIHHAFFWEWLTQYLQRNQDTVWETSRSILFPLHNYHNISTQIFLVCFKHVIGYDPPGAALSFPTCEDCFIWFHFIFRPHESGNCCLNCLKAGNMDMEALENRNPSQSQVTHFRFQTCNKTYNIHHNRFFKMFLQ